MAERSGRGERTGWAIPTSVGVVCLLAATTLLGGCLPDATPDGSAAVETVFNHDPVVRSIVPTPTRIDVGEGTALSVLVSDPDGDALLFDWTADCDGDFEPALTAEPTFTLTTPIGDTCTLHLEVRDDHGGAGEGAVTIATGPAPVPQEPPSTRPE